jgi:HEAT repeat protein
VSSLVELPKVFGFFSYSRDDDEDSKGRLSRLRDAIERELGQQLGIVEGKRFCLFQDKEAIPLGTRWETKIKEAIEESQFFIPIVTPRAVGSRHCKFEFESFIERERALDRNDLVFPILHIAVPALKVEEEWRSDPVLSIIGQRQYADWRNYRFQDVDSSAFSQEIANFCDKIVRALRQSSVSPEQRRQPIPHVNNGQSPRSSRDHAAIEAFLGSDPIAGEDAIGPLVAAGRANLPILLARATRTPQQVMRLRKLCARLGAKATDPLIDAIRNGDWEVKVSAAPCFAALNADTATGNAIYNLLKISDFDVQRYAIAAAGHLGYSSSIPWQLFRLAAYDDLNDEHPSINDYSLGKLYSYVIEALARGFSRTGKRSLLECIQEFFDLCEKNRQSSNLKSSLADGLEDLRPVATDQLIANWFRRSDGPWASLALDALARLRLGRVIEPIASCLHDPRSDVRIGAGICLGNTGSSAAADLVSRALIGGAPSDGALWAASMLYWRNVEWVKSEQFVNIAREGTEISGQMMVCLALRNHPAAVEIARPRLAQLNPFLRGPAAIALAYAQTITAAMPRTLRRGNKFMSRRRPARSERPDRRRGPAGTRRARAPDDLALRDTHRHTNG